MNEARIHFKPHISNMFWCQRIMKKSKRRRSTKVEKRAISRSHRSAGVDRVANAKRTEAVNLHIGGREHKEGWINLNIQAGPDVDVVGNCIDLSQFTDASFEMVYASHVLEHLGYRNEMLQALREIYRVLKPEGVLCASVPDLDVLCQLYVHPDVTEQHRWHIMRIMFGGQKNEYDFHKVGLSWVVLQDFLRQAGFFTSQRVDVFDIFDDTNKLEVLGQLISLNVEARKPAIATG